MIDTDKPSLEQRIDQMLETMGRVNGGLSNPKELMGALLGKLDRQADLLSESTKAQHQATLAVSNLCVAITALADAIAAPVEADEETQSVERDFDGNPIR